MYVRRQEGLFDNIPPIKPTSNIKITGFATLKRLVDCDIIPVSSHCNHPQALMERVRPHAPITMDYAYSNSSRVIDTHSMHTTVW